MTLPNNMPFSNDAAEMRELFIAVCDETVTDEQFQAFETMLRKDVQTRDEFARFVQLYALLQRKFTIVRPRQYDSRRSDSFDEATAPITNSIPPVVVIPDSCSTPSCSFSDWSLSYLVALVMLAVVLVIGAAVRISNWRPERVAGQHLPSGQMPLAPVGRITSLADCQWSKQGLRVRGLGSGEQEVRGQWPVASDPPSALRPPPFGKTVFLSDRLIVSSGLMEITYDTGAKVILQGPCTYEIDSDRGGYLAIGRLTARVEKESEVQGPRSRATHPSTFSLQPSALFAVRTPTATVTDLGTEFGVEVEQSGATRSHVFQGSVEVRSSNSRSQATSGPLVEILRAGQSIRVDRGRKGVVTFTREPGKLGRFVRQISKTTNLHITRSRPSPPARMSSEAYADYVLSLEPAAYYRMERPKAEKNRLVVFDSAPGGHHGVFWSQDRSVMPYAPGRFGDAMSFRGSQVGDCVMVRGVPKPKHNQFTVVAWIMLADRLADRCMVFTQWGVSNSGGRGGNVPKIFPFGVDNSNTSDNLSPNRWHHVVSIVSKESGKTTSRTYENGKFKRLAPSDNASFELPEIFWNIGGLDPNLAANGDSMRGWIDEFAIFNKALSPETIERLYLGGVPAVKDDDEFYKK